MKRRRIWIIAAMVCVAAMLVAVLWPLEKEPKYKGKRLSEWVFHGVQSLRNEHEMAVAIRAMDTNSLPFFVKWISYTPSPRKTAWLATIAKVPAWLGGPRLLRAVDGDFE